MDWAGVLRYHKHAWPAHFDRSATPSSWLCHSAHSIPAAAVFVSHEHFDHNFTEAAQGNPVIIQPIASPAPDIHGSLAAPGEPSGRIDYKRIFAYHDNEHGALRGPDTMTVLDVDGLRILHMGDIGEWDLPP